MRSGSPSVSNMSIPGASIMTVLPEKGRIPRNDKITKISETSIKVKESIQEPDNPSIRATEDIIINEK